MVEGPERVALRRSAAAAPAWLTRSRLWGWVVLGLLYYGSARFGYAFGFSGPIAAIVWLPVGVGAAFLTIGGLSFWPGALIGDLLADQYTSIPVWGAIGQTIGNLLEVIVIAAVVREVMRRWSPLESLRGVAGMLAGICAGTAVSAIVGPLSLAASGGLSIGSVPHVSWTWWLGDTCGGLLVVPLALAWSRRPRLNLTPRRAFEAFVALAVIGGLSLIAARGVTPAYLVFPILAIVAIRFGARGATTAVFFSVAVVVWGETDRHGHFVVDSFAPSVLKTQLFIVVLAISSLVATALVAERGAALREMRASEVRAFTAAEAERRRMERDLHDGAQQRLLALAILLGLNAREATTPTLQRFFADTQGQLHQAIDELRDLSHGIHPSVLSELGLANATRSLAGRCPIPVNLVELPTRSADPDSQAAAYYILTETLANAQKHSDASSIRIRVSADDAGLQVVVEDNGVGGAIETAGSGLMGMRQRVETLGGSFALESPAGVGTRVTAVIPARVI